MEVVAGAAYVEAFAGAAAVYAVASAAVVENGLGEALPQASEMRDLVSPPAAAAAAVSAAAALDRYLEQLECY